MMVASHPLFATRSLLQDIAAKNDSARLQECLSGKFLPALGGQEHTADIIYHALCLTPFNPDLVTQLAELLAVLCRQLSESQARVLSAQAAATAGSASIEVATSTGAGLLDDEGYVFNLFLFASYLPPHEDLFEALYGFHTGGLNIPVVLSNQGRAARQLRRALTYQQYDNRLEEYWLSLITIPVPYSHGGNLSSERETDIMDGWRGLLWIPPSEEDQKTGNTISIKRMSQGLLAIHNAVKDTTQALAVLREALPQLDESYPRSPEFWRDQFGPVLPDWPELLRDIVAEHWPILSQEEGGVQIPQDALPVWQLLTPQEREDIEDAASNENTEHWKLAWDKLFVYGCSNSVPPQEWRTRLNQIKSGIEEQAPKLVSRNAASTASGTQRQND